MEPQPNQRSTPPPPPPPPPAPPRAPAAPRAPANACPTCGEDRAAGARYCEECGYDFGPATPGGPEEAGLLRGPLLWLFALFWLALAVGGLIFLYSAIWQR